MSETYEQEQARILGLKARAQDAINNFFEDNPEVDWVWVGEETACVHGGDIDDNLPTPEAMKVFEQEKGERMELFGKDIIL